MTKQYTTEEIINRLKAGERITAIDGCNMPNGRDALIIGKSYEVKEYFGGGDFEIESEEYKCHEFDAETFSQFFMFTSDYEAMKSWELKRKVEDDYNKLLKDEMNHKKEELTEPQIPEWLQRERVRFWGNRFGEYKAAYMKNTDDAISMANEDLEQFDKRFLNKEDGK